MTERQRVATRQRLKPCRKLVATGHWSAARTGSTPNVIPARGPAICRHHHHCRQPARGTRGFREGPVHIIIVATMMP
jgi:hypothetical protein